MNKLGVVAAFLLLVMCGRLAEEILARGYWDVAGGLAALVVFGVVVVVGAWAGLCRGART